MGNSVSEKFFRQLDDFLDDYYSVNKNSGMLRITLKDEIIYENIWVMRTLKMR